MSRGVERFYRWLVWRAGDDQQCHWRQERMAEELGVTLRTVERWVAELKRRGLLEVRKRSQESAVMTVSRPRQMTLDFSTPLAEHLETSGCRAPENTDSSTPGRVAISGEVVENVTRHSEMSGQMSGQMSGCQRGKESLELLETTASQPARKPPAVEIPEEVIEDEGGRRFMNPAFIRVRDALIASEEKIRRARAPDRYRAAIVRRVMGGGP
jgi:hypothetical protein